MKYIKGRDSYKKSYKTIVGVCFSGKEHGLLERLDAWRKANLNIARGPVLRAAVEEFLKSRGA